MNICMYVMCIYISTVQHRFVHLVGVEEVIYSLHGDQQLLLHELQLNQHQSGDLARYDTLHWPSTVYSVEQIVYSSTVCQYIVQCSIKYSIIQYIINNVVYVVYSVEYYMGVYSIQNNTHSHLSSISYISEIGLMSIAADMRRRSPSLIPLLCTLTWYIGR